MSKFDDLMDQAGELAEKIGADMAKAYNRLQEIEARLSKLEVEVKRFADNVRKRLASAEDRISKLEAEAAALRSSHPALDFRTIGGMPFGGGPVGSLGGPRIPEPSE